MKRILAVLLILLFSGIAQANGMPTFTLENEASSIAFPLKETTIALTKETLILDISKTAHIHATYNLQNKSNEATEIGIAFYLPQHTKDINILVDSKPTEWTYLETQTPEYEKIWIDPRSKKQYNPQIGSHILTYQIIYFELYFKPQEEKVLEITYHQSPSTDYRRYDKPIYRFDYILWPAQHWSNFGELDLDIKVSKGYHWTTNIEYSTRTTFQELPTDVLSIYTLADDAKRVIINWKQYWVYALYLSPIFFLALLVVLVKVIGILRD